MKNLKEEYHKKLTEVGKLVDDTIDEFHQKAFQAFPEKRELYERMLNRKRGTQKLRAMAAYLAFSAVVPKPENDGAIRRIIAAVELENYSNYELNWLFDRKASTESDSELKVAGLATHCFMNDAVRILEDMPQIAFEFLDMNDKVHRGWIPELYDLKIDNERIMNDFDNFWKAYKIRNHEAGGQFYQRYAKIASIYYQRESDPNLILLQSIYAQFGASVQIMNDLGDLLVTDGQIVHEKNLVDQFSDLRNGPVTWPTWAMYTHGTVDDKAFIKSLLGKRYLTPEEGERVSSILYTKGAYETISKYLRKKRSELQSQIKLLDFGYETRGLMGVMVSMLSSNKIMHSMREQYAQHNTLIPRLTRT